MASWFEHVDIYCERTSPEFWAEPVNALTNLSFILAGLVGLYWIRKFKSQSSFSASMKWAQFLSWNAIVIGIGSFLFHTHATRAAQLADVLPITIFMVAFLCFALRELLKWKTPALVLGVVGFLLAGSLAGYVERHFELTFLNGSSAYLHALLFLAVVGHFIRDTHWPEARLFLVAMAIFSISLVLRSLDIAICESWPLGTHFLWHVLNGALLAVLIRIPLLSLVQKK